MHYLRERPQQCVHLIYSLNLYNAAHALAHFKPAILFKVQEGQLLLLMFGRSKSFFLNDLPTTPLAQKSTLGKQARDPIEAKELLPTAILLNQQPTTAPLVKHSSRLQDWNRVPCQSAALAPRAPHPLRVKEQILVRWTHSGPLPAAKYVVRIAAVWADAVQLLWVPPLQRKAKQGLKAVFLGELDQSSLWPLTPTAQSPSALEGSARQHFNDKVSGHVSIHIL